MEYGDAADSCHGVSTPIPAHPRAAREDADTVSAASDEWIMMQEGAKERVGQRVRSGV